jgi:NAD(P)-dependent dehydrogenase (short-subunit alcohol dehydrogenase family)
MEELKKEVGGTRIYSYLADLSDMQQVVRVAADIASEHTDIQVFVSNAGILGNERPVVNAGGIESTFATNYLSHYLLQSQLAASILKNDGVIFNVCSQSYDWYSLDFDDLQSVNKYQPMKAYGRSKRMLLLLGRKTANAGIKTFNIDPGTFRSGISRSRGWAFRLMYNLAKFGMKTPAEAVRDIVALIDGQSGHLPSGELIRKGKVIEIDYNDEEIGKLMQATKAMTGVDIDEKLTTDD